MHNNKSCPEQALKSLPETNSLCASAFCLPWKGLFPFLLMLELAVTFSFLKYCSTTKLKEMKNCESDTKTRTAFENHDMLIKEILLWIWSVFEVFKFLQLLERERCHSVPLLLTYCEKLLGALVATGYLILHGCPSNSNPPQTENASTAFSIPSPPWVWERALLFQGRNLRENPLNCLFPVSSFSLPQARKQSRLLTARLAKRAWKGSISGTEKCRTWPLDNLKGKYGGEGKFLRVKEGLEPLRNTRLSCVECTWILAITKWEKKITDSIIMIGFSSWRK